MRVIAGLAKGAKLFSPEGIDVRPTLDRVKESVFSILYPYLNGAKVLDLFAGTGSLGIEALSRGAKNCIFVDLSRKSCACVEKNLQKTKLFEISKVYTMSAERFLESTFEVFDIIFLDPPYSKGIEDEVLKHMDNVINNDTVIVLETEIKPEGYCGFKIIRQAKYGRVYITLLKKDSDI